MGVVMEKRLAVVIGAGPGLGQALAERWAKEGFAVVLMARDEARLGGMVRTLRDKGCEAYAQVVDCASNEGIRTSLAKEIGRAHV